MHGHGLAERIASVSSAHHATLTSRRRSLPMDDVIDLAALDVVDEPGDHHEGLQVGRGGEELDILPDSRRVIVDWEEPELGARELLKLLVGHAGEAALGVLHHHDRVDAEHVGGKGQTPEHVVGHSAASIADHVCLPEVEPNDSKHVDAGVHTGDDGQAAPRTGGGDVGPRRRVRLVGGEEPSDLGHAP